MLNSRSDVDHRIRKLGVFERHSLVLVADPSELRLDLIQSSSLGNLLFANETSLLQALLQLLTSSLQVLDFLGVV